LNDVAEDASVREARLRRRNRTTLAWLSAALLVLVTLGYLFGRWLLKHPPTSAH
jgi:type VI protein secretion system component VasF